MLLITLVLGFLFGWTIWKKGFDAISIVVGIVSGLAIAITQYFKGDAPWTLVLYGLSGLFLWYLIFALVRHLFLSGRR